MMEELNFSIHVIGAGGTGGYVLKEISSYISTKIFMNLKIKELHIYDGDIVEAKNLARQKTFIADDVGGYKAEVLAAILNDRDFQTSLTNELCWNFHNEYITRENDLLGNVIKENLAKKYIPIIVGCVDNHGARLYIEETVSKLDTVFYIDTANGEKGDGSVFFYNRAKSVAYGKLRSEVDPSVLEDTREINEISCEELNNSNPQHQFTNMYSAMQAILGVTHLLENGEFKAGCLLFNADTFSTKFIEYKGKEKKNERNSRKKSSSNGRRVNSQEQKS